MAIAIEKRFTVHAGPDVVWTFLTDPHRVARCLPGAAVSERIDEQTYAGTITVKVGPVASSFKGKLRFERLDPTEWIAEIVASGQDVRGKGAADMRMTSRLAQLAGGTEVTVASEVSVTGMLAQFGRGMIQDVSDQLFQRFTDAMRAELESEGKETGAAVATPGAEAIDVVSLGARAAGRAVGRTVRRRGFWAVVGILTIALVLWLWLR